MHFFNVLARVKSRYLLGIGKDICDR